MSAEIDRQPGWYWVKATGRTGWMLMRWDGEIWKGEDVKAGPAVFDVISPRIPTPDEPWQCVPVTPTKAMKKAADYDTPGPITAFKCWEVMLEAAPRP